ncbi:hypothetical protein PRZ48_010980 [Zasmidium cellare]|uniref:Uncharacterized protein n=1 Tax=Zasmidium cellare TaxID=395010 RepID=A0ABR0EA66_ZASCE|nr:hypothetical protein PRZ48_010980 [Zasmidium cellare]
MALHKQDEAYAAFEKDPESFWNYQAEQLVWHKKPQTTYKKFSKKLPNGTQHDTWQWYPDGEISTSYNAVTRHVEAGNGDNIAIKWDSPVTGSKQNITYKQLEEDISILAGALREEGVRKGDVVIIYMPMIPAALVGMLAVARLGAIHAVVFGGFSASSLAQRIDDSKAKAILTASCGIEGAKGPLPYKPMVRGAIEQAKHKPLKTFIWQRDEARWNDTDRLAGERTWQRVVKGARDRGVRAENVPVKSNDPLYIIYTSGTTGSPKGVLREAGGHAVGLNFTVRYVFGIRGPGDTLFTASDIGWVVGHSYIVYGPLLAGASTILFEGKPVGTPNADTFWRILDEHKVNTMFTAPTALRAIRKDDPENKFFKARGSKGGLKNLRALFLAGERSEPAIVEMYNALIQKHCAPNATVIDNWWSSESGSPMTSLSLLPGVALNSTDHTFYPPLPIKPGSAGKPVPGFKIHIVSDDGHPVPQGEMGNIVLGTPLSPTGLTTLWQDAPRFHKSYLARFEGKYIDTGDAGMIDADGFVHIMSRADDVINVAAHRLSTGQIEQAISTHPSITEAAVVSIPDPLKGHAPFAFIAISPAPSDPSALLSDLNSRLRHAIGPIASLAGFIAKPGIIPKTRSGKTLRRCLKEMLEFAVAGEWEKEVVYPATIEDPAVVGKAREAVREYFEGGEGKKLKAKL